MSSVSIALIKESNKRLCASATKAVVDRSSTLSPETINDMMKKAFNRLAR